MAGNLVKRVMLKIVADDGDTEAKLDKISAKADELARKHPDLTPRINTAAASAKLAVLKRELKSTEDQANRGIHFNVSGIVPAIGQMGLFSKVMMGLNVATTFAEPLLAGVTVAAGGLASGLTAAGAGIGAFGLVAKGVYSQVSSQIQNYRADQLAAQEATSKATRTADLLKMKDALNGLTGGQRQFAQSIIGAQNDWQNFVTANTSGVASIFHQGMGLLPGLFHDLQGFLPPVERALSTIIGQLGQGLKSSGFQSFIHSLQANAGPALIKIADTVGHLFSGVGGIIKAFMPESQQMLGGLDNLMARFAHWGQTLSQHSGFQSLMGMFHSETPLAVKTLGNLAAIIKTVVADMTGLDGVGNSKTLLQIAMPFTSLLKVLVQLNPNLVRVGLYLLAAYSGGKKLKDVFGGLKDGIATISSLASGVQNFAKGFGSAEQAAAEGTGAWGTWGGKISSVFSSAQGMITGLLQKMGILKVATEEETVAQDGLDVSMDANPIGLIVIAIGALVIAFVELWKHSAAFRDFWKGLWHDILGIVDSAVSFIRGHWQLILGILTGPIGAATIFIVDHWHQIVSGAESMISSVISFFTSLPGRIMGALDSLAHDLWNIGANAIHGLLSGIESGISGVLGTVEHLASDVSGAFSKVLSIFSPSRVFYKHGQMIALGLTQGMDSGHGQVTAAAQRMAAATLGGGAGGYGRPAGGAQTIVLQIAPGGGTAFDQFMTMWLRQHARLLGGGNVQTAFGRP